MGSLERANLPDLTLAERLSICRTRVLSTALHINVNMKKTKMQGHSICFPDEAASTCGSQLPDAKFVKESVTVIFEGPAGRKRHSKKLEDLLRQLGK